MAAGALGQNAADLASPISARPEPSHDLRPELEWAVRQSLLLCGAAATRDTDEFVRLVAEILMWSGDHARQRALERLPICTDDTEWTCAQCCEESPANFDECWNCGAVRPAQD